MRLFVTDGADQRRLAVAPAGAADPGACRGAAGAPVAADQQAGRQRAPRGERDGDPAGRRGLRDHGLAGHLRDPRLGGHRRKEGVAQVAVFQHEAHRPLFQLAIGEVEEERRRALTDAAIRGADAEDRLRKGRDAIPDADRLQEPLRGERQRIGAAVEAVIGPRGLGQRVDHGDGQPPLCKGQRKRRAVQPAADDQDVAFRFHARQYGRRVGIVHALLCRYRRAKRGRRRQWRQSGWK